jgi:hypothetical protein
MKIILWLIIIGLALLCLSFQAVSAPPIDFTGMVAGSSGTNILYVNVGQSNIPGISGGIQVLLSIPVSQYVLNSLVNRQLDFAYLGRDITGKIVSSAYYNGIPLEDLQYYRNYPYPYFYPGFYGNNYYGSYGYGY